MRQHARIGWVTAFMLLIACSGNPAFAVPSTDMAVSTSSEEQPDSRLLQNVTYKAKARTVKQVCADLSKMTGVTIKAGSSESDWFSRDRKMNVFAEDVPLVNLINSIARVMKFTLTRGKDDPPSYRMYMSPRMRAYAQNLRDQQQEQIKRLRDEGRTSLIAGLEKVRDMTPEQLESLKQEDPGLYLYGATGVGESLGSLLESVPQLKTALLRGDGRVFNGSDMAPEAQQALQRLIGSIGAYRNLGGGEVRVPAAFGKDVAKVTLHTNFATRDKEASGITAPSSFIADVTVFDGQGRFAIPLYDPASDEGGFRAAMGVRSLEQKRPFSEIRKEFSAQADEIWEAECRRYQVAEDAENADAHIDDPTLAYEIEATFKTDPTLADTLESLSMCGIAGVSDWWSDIDRFGSVKSGRTQLGHVLGEIAEAYHVNWSKRTSIIEYRDRSWFTKLDTLVPESLISLWRRTLKETGTLDIRDLMRMAQLTRQQMEGITDEVITTSGALKTAYNNRFLLEACGAIETNQWRRVLSSGGLDLAELNDDQWEAMGQAIVYKNAVFLKDPDARVVFKGTRTPKGNQFEYSFVLTTSSDIPPALWTFTTPHYVEKPKQQTDP